MNHKSDTQIMASYAFEMQRKAGKSLKQGNEMINANDRLHHIVKAQITKHLRELSAKSEPEVTGTNWKKGDDPIWTNENPCQIAIFITPPTRRRMDPPNWYPTIKALLDGMTDAGIWTDDNQSVIKRFIFEGVDNRTTGKNYHIKIDIFSH